MKMKVIVIMNEDESECKDEDESECINIMVGLVSITPGHVKLD